MTRMQLDIIKKSTYFLLVLGLGGSVMWLSSGGTVFRADLTSPTSTTTSGITPTGGLLGAVSSNQNIQTGSSTNTNTEVTASTSSTIMQNVNINSSSSAPGVVLKPTEGFATLAASAPYSSELASPLSDAYSEESTRIGTPSPVENANSKSVGTVVSPQVITATPAKAPKSGPEFFGVLCFALLVTGGTFFLKKRSI